MAVSGLLPLLIGAFGHPRLTAGLIGRLLAYGITLSTESGWHWMPRS